MTTHQKKTQAQRRAERKATSSSSHLGSDPTDIVATLARRLNAVLLPGIPPPTDLLSHPEFAANLANYIGVAPESQRMLKNRCGESALGELLTDAWIMARGLGDVEARKSMERCTGDSALAWAQASASTSPSTSASASAEAASALPSNDTKDNLFEGKAFVDLKQACNQHQIDTAIDLLASQLAFHQTMSRMPPVFKDAFKNPRVMAEVNRDAWANLSADQQPVQHEDAAALWQTRALAVLQLEGLHAAMSSSLLQALSYCIEHNKSRTAFDFLKAQVCLCEAFDFSTSLINRTRDSALRQAVDLFAEACILDDKVFGTIDEAELTEAMARASTAALRESDGYLPALLVKSRCQAGKPRLQHMSACIRALDDVANKRWMHWKARLHELQGLAHGAVGDLPAALQHYQESLAAGGGRLTQYCIAFVLHSRGDHNGALIALQSYLEEGNQDESLLDEWQLPHAVYLKGIVHVRLGDLAAAKTCLKHALALETVRCPFFGPVDCSAKRSLTRICAVAFGGSDDRAVALSDFRKAYRNRVAKSLGSEPTDDLPKPRGLADLQGSERFERHAALSHQNSSDVQSFRVHILQYSRNPDSLRRALLEGELLEPCRARLAEEKLQHELPCGAKVFVNPKCFQAVVEAVKDKDLKPWHVVVSDEFYEEVIASVRSLPSREQVREKSTSSFEVCKTYCNHCGATPARYRCALCRHVYYCDRTCQSADFRMHRDLCGKFDIPRMEKHTFVHVVIPSSTRSEPSTRQTASTTDTDPAKGGNPRNA